LILGPAPIVDFDGTLAVLPIDWAALRARLDVRAVDDLWVRGDPGAWEAVTAVEIAAAEVAAPHPAVHAQLAQVKGFAVLSANSELAVHTFLGRNPSLARACRLVVGREALGGPKSNPANFRVGFELCRAATAEDRGDGPVVYVGDAVYEIELARRLGALAISVVELGR
jgi:phosphoglycolate phosphatase-like HAD superfamily hydrolase